MAIPLGTLATRQTSGRPCAAASRVECTTIWVRRCEMKKRYRPQLRLRDQRSSLGCRLLGIPLPVGEPREDPQLQDNEFSDQRMDAEWVRPEPAQPTRGLVRSVHAKPLGAFRSGSPRFFQTPSAHENRDRKSTRLNSSHL